MAITLALTPDTRWDVDVATYLDAARSAGFGAVGLHAALADAEVAAGLAARQLRCHELLALRMRAPDVEEQARELAAAASVVGATWVLTGGFRGRVTPDVLETVARVAAIVAEAGSRLAIEFSPGGAINSIPAALEVVQAAGPDRAGVLIDTWHFSHGPSTWDDLAAIPLERIAYVQFSDALPPASDDLFDETMNRRAMPGDGVLELGRFADTLLSRGWEGDVSLEVLNLELSWLPVAEFAARAHQAAARYWS